MKLKLLSLEIGRTPICIDLTETDEKLHCLVGGEHPNLPAVVAYPLFIAAVIGPFGEEVLRLKPHLRKKRAARVNSFVRKIVKEHTPDPHYLTVAFTPIKRRGDDKWELRARRLAELAQREGINWDSGLATEEFALWPLTEQVKHCLADLFDASSATNDWPPWQVTLTLTNERPEWDTLEVFEKSKLFLAQSSNAIRQQEEQAAEDGRHSQTIRRLDAEKFGQLHPEFHKELSALHDPIVQRFQNYLDSLAGEAFPKVEMNQKLVKDLHAEADQFGVAFFYPDEHKRYVPVRIRCLDEKRSEAGIFYTRTANKQRTVLASGVLFPQLKAGRLDRHADE